MLNKLAIASSALALSALFPITLVNGAWAAVPTAASAAVTAASGTAVTTKVARKHSSGKSRRTGTVAGRGAYLVPPPPPYTPSILAENAGGQATLTAVDQAQEEAKPENPYRKYIYTPNENDTPHVVQPNKYVSYWNGK